MILKAWSKGLYANWYFYAPDRILFDCGEGASLFLRTHIFAVETIVLSHGHMDHVAGLQSFLSLRQSTKGDNDKPLTILYPQGDRSIEILREALGKLYAKLIRYPLTWRPINAGDRIPLRKGRELEAFSVKHPADNPLGFRIVEKRKRLKPSLRGTPGPELAKLATEEKFDFYEAPMIVYSGDGMPIPIEHCRNAELLIHDATFIDASERKGPTHATVGEVFSLAEQAKVKELILCHLSPRYNHSRKIEEGLAKLRPPDGVKWHWIPHNRTFTLDPDK